MSNVKLAIRVRPFSERELKSERDRVPVISVEDNNTITITNIKVNASGAGDSRERVRHYNTDYTFDSSCDSTHPSYASQEKVFQTIGQDVLAAIFNGCSACVLAYGQSATGKTHTMMGTEDQPGLIPKLCVALTEKGLVDITVSFLEIYNERVHDLLASEVLTSFNSLPRRRGNTSKDLRVREHPEKGPYVQNLRRVSVNDVSSLLGLVEEGAKRRRTAATRRNSASSRSHALLEISTPEVTLHLADLAGSEKASWDTSSGCCGRQKEGSNINKSLVALSNVISALVNGRKGRGRFVPYRDSALTWLLKDCFTGGAATFIIATVSPSVACYGESASTLRWAARARQLPNGKQSIVGSEYTSRAALQSQLNKLLVELTKHHIRYKPETGKLEFENCLWRLKETISLPENTDSRMNLNNSKADVQSESTTSSVASGSSDVISSIDKNAKITTVINKDIERIFSTSLERASSGSDLKVKAPLRHKKRQYKSHEVLATDKVINHKLQDENEISINEEKYTDSVKTPSVPILYDNQRAEIVASVTERLYSKLKKKEEQVVSKMESVVDKKIIEPLTELKICTNARQRLMDMSQKAMRNKRRIGIPAHTQTRINAIRVKDQGIDVQKDLSSYFIRDSFSYNLHRDVGTETTPITPRFKDVAVGPKSNCLNFSDSSTLTETKEVIQKNTFSMTEMSPKVNISTQTKMVPPPRRKRRPMAYSKLIKPHTVKYSCDECIVPPVVSINIAQTYSNDSETQSSDELISNNQSKSSKSPSVTMTPDLLTNHSNIDTNVSDEDETQYGEHKITPVARLQAKPNNSCDELILMNQVDFPDQENCELPRVSMGLDTSKGNDNIKDIILGRNSNVYPFNIVLSPPKARETKRLVKFIDSNCKSGSNINNTDNHSDYQNSPSLHSETNARKKYSHIDSISSDTSKQDSDSFVWKRCGSVKKNITKMYSPVNTQNKVYKNSKTKLYREFLGLDNNGFQKECCPQCHQKELSSSESENTDDITNVSFRQRRQFFEEKFRADYDRKFEFLEKQLLESSDKLTKSANKYTDYLTNYHQNVKSTLSLTSRTKPTNYLQHLVQLRRDTVRASSESSDNIDSYKNCGTYSIN